MAENIQDSSEHIKPSGPMSSTENMHRAGAIDANVKHSRPNTTQKVRSESVEERDNRLKMLREKQNEERQKKLEELKAQALAAQRFREMKEEERRRRIEELRIRDNDRRQQNKTYNAQVGERKRLIYEAERDRRESILKKNQEREARFDLKKRNERSSMAFAFGSSTPRMLEPADTGGSFWGHRRATSTNNIMFAAVPLTRRSSERELDGSKKRATSAGGLDRSNTDGPSRPDSSLSHQSTSSVHSSVTMRSRPIAAPRKPRPASIAVTGVSSDRKLANDAKNADISKPPLPRSRKTSVGKVAPDRTAKLSKTSPKTTPKVTPLQSPCTEAPAVPSAPTVAAVSVSSTADHDKPVIVETIPATDINPTPVTKETTENVNKVTATSEIAQEKQQLDEIITEAPKTVSQEILVQVENTANTQPQASSTPVAAASVPAPASAPVAEDTNLNLETADMTASMIAKVRITTEEEAKAALAERRRLAREEAERQAEAERLRIEEEFRAEQERQRLEEEQARILVEQQRHAEEERLAQAIKEAQKREEEERLRREEELKQKLEKEEQERKAREESEKQRIEMQKRLEQEEKEREARRKRVEAIMLRTRASKGGAGNNQQKDENTGSEKGSNEETKNQVNNKPTIESYEKEVSEKEAALFNGSFNKSSTPVVISKENGENGEPQHSNGHRNGVVDSEDFSKVNKSLIEHNVTNTLLDLGELDPFKNANTNLDIPADKITNEDNVNSNNTTESHSTTDFLL